MKRGVSEETSSIVVELEPVVDDVDSTEASPSATRGANINADSTVIAMAADSHLRSGSDFSIVGVFTLPSLLSRGSQGPRGSGQGTNDVPQSCPETDAIANQSHSTRDNGGR